MKTAFKIAWREARASAGKFLFVILAVALGVGSLTGVRGFSESFAAMLRVEARALMAGDLSLRIFAQPTEEQLAALGRLRASKIEHTRLVETLSMVSAPGADPVLVTVKAVEPHVFPFYGSITLAPAQRIADALTAGSTLLSQDLMDRLRVTRGGRVRVGDAEFTVAGTVVTEPDRLYSAFTVGPRLLLSRDGLDRTGLIRPGSRAVQRFLFKLNPAAPPVAQVSATLKKTFPEAIVVDYRDANPTLERGLDRSTNFLSLVSLIALIVGALGVATAMHAHLQQKLDGIAIMKSIGARSGQVTRIYVLQTLMLGVAGGLAGAVVGAMVQSAFPYVLGQFFPIQPQWNPRPVAMLQGLLIGVLTTLLFTLPPLLGIRKIRPAAIFRRHMAEAKPTWRERFRQWREAIAVGALIVAGVAGVAMWLAGGNWNDRVRLGGLFIGGLIGSLLLLSAAGWVLLHGLRWFMSRAPMRLSPELRHGIANLYRPGSQAIAILTALGVGVMFTLTVYLVQHSILSEMTRNTPPGMSNVFLLDITAEQRDQVLEMLRKHPGAEREPELISTVMARLKSVNGRAVDQMELGNATRRYRAVRPMMTMGKMPAGTQVMQGKWWTTWDAASPQVSILEGAAKSLQAGPGSVLEWDVFGRTIRARVAAVHRTEFHRLGSTIDFVFNPGVLDGLPTVYYAGLRTRPESAPALQRVAYDRFPTVTVINIADVVDRIQQVVDQIAVVVRFISAFSILAGVIILASSVAGTRYRRVRETVIFKTLGATRMRVIRMFSAEFLILGATAGVMGSALATVFTAVVLKRFFDGTEFRLELAPNLVSVAATAVIAAAAGWLASWRILGQKPLEILRGE